MANDISKKLAQQIVESVKDICGYDINFINRDGYIYASTEKDRIGDFHEIGKRCILSMETIEVEPEDSYYGTRSGVNIPIKYQGECNAVIGISGSPSEVRKYAYLAQRIALLILREKELESENYSRKSQLYYIVESLISDGEISPITRKFLSDYSISENSEYRVVLVELNSRYNQSNISLVEDRILSLFRKTGETLYSYRYPREYVLIMKDSSFNHRKSMLGDFIKGEYPVIRMAVGGRYTISHIDLSYREALLAIRSRDSDEISEYDKLGVETLVNLIPDTDSVLYRDKFLGKLTEEDKALLRTYYRENMSLKDTADKMYLHKNTIQYRLDRIYENTGFNPRRFSDATGFYFALML